MGLIKTDYEYLNKIDGIYDNGRLAAIIVCLVLHTVSICAFYHIFFLCTSSQEVKELYICIKNSTKNVQNQL